MTFWGYALAFSRIFWDFCFTLDLSASYDSCQAGRERLPSAEQQHKNQLGLRPVFFQRGVFAELIWTSFLTWIGGWGYHLHPRLLGGPHPRPHLPRHSFKILICFNFTRKIRDDNNRPRWRTRLLKAKECVGQTQGGRALAQNFCAVQSSATLAGPGRPARPAVWHTAAQWNMILKFLNITHILHRINFNHKQYISNLIRDPWISQISWRNKLSYWNKS
jgi:hypothetical protein